MNQLQWFPGHMKKTLDQIRVNLNFVNIVLVILDARIPFSSMNWQLLDIIKKKPCLLLFTKKFLSDSSKSHFFFDYYQKKGFTILEIDAKRDFNISKIYSKALSMVIAYHQKNSHTLCNQFVKPLKCMIVGVPNVGKSTLINKLLHRNIVRTANIAGVTKHFQWINVNNNLRLLDTSGVLCHKFLDNKIAFSLALVGYMNDAILPLEKVIKYALNYFQKYYSHYLHLYFHLSLQEIHQENLFSIIINQYKNLLVCKNMDYTNIYQIILKKMRDKFLNQVNLDLDLI